MTSEASERQISHDACPPTVLVRVLATMAMKKLSAHIATPFATTLCFLATFELFASACCGEKGFCVPGRLSFLCARRKRTTHACRSVFFACSGYACCLCLSFLCACRKRTKYIRRRETQECAMGSIFLIESLFCTCPRAREGNIHVFFELST